MNLTKHIDLDQIHMNLPQMSIEDVLDRMLTSCRPRFRVQNVEWPGLLMGTRDDCIQMEKGCSGVLDAGVALLNPFTKSVSTLEQWTLSVAVFPAGARWHFRDQPQTDRARGVPIRLAVLILPTNPEEFLKVLHNVNALFNPLTAWRLSFSASPKEILKLISPGLSSTQEGL